MILDEFFKNKEIKAKQKTLWLCRELLENRIAADDVVDFAATAKDPVKAACIEALQHATKAKPEIATAKIFSFAVQNLSAKAANVKWESAKVIGNVARLFPDKLDEAITRLLANTEDSGTVVRWSAAFALGEILKLETKRNQELLPAIEAIINREEKNSIRKIYHDAIKKTQQPVKSN